MQRPGQDGFGWLAPIYDPLASLIFAGQIKKAETHFLSGISPQGSILILGGGTGWIVEKILAIKPEATIYFVDSSEGMIRRAMKQYAALSQVAFLHGTVDKVPLKKFDVIILPFFLDMFPDSSQEELISVISRYSNAYTSWLITDFMDHGKWWEKGLLFLMYFFFRLTCKIESATLPHWPSHLHKAGLTRIETKSFYGGFIESSVYRSA